jgi:general stress protein 26
MDPDFADGKYLAFLATVDEEGLPHVRPIIGILAEKKLYFCARHGAEKTKEIALNPTVELIITKEKGEGRQYVRFTGEAFRIFDEKLVQDTLSGSGYSPDEYIRMGKDESVCMYELCPTKVRHYVPEEKCERDITGIFFDTGSQ